MLPFEKAFFSADISHNHEDGTDNINHAGVFLTHTNTHFALLLGSYHGYAFIVTFSGH